MVWVEVFLLFDKGDFLSIIYKVGMVKEIVSR